MVALSVFHIVVTGLLLWQRTAMPWVLAWSLLSVLLLAVRLLISRAYRQCSEDDDPEIWAWRFTIAAWAASALWGTLSVLIVTASDPVVHVIVVGAQWSHLCSVFTRNSCEPRAAFGQVCLVKLPLMLACFVTQDGTYCVYGLCVAVGIVIARSTIQFLRLQTVELLNANEQLASSRDQLEQANLQLEALATTDALTSMVNRRGFDLALRREWRRALRSFQPISLLLLDLDYFKRLNDTLGHQAGDECLRRVAECIQSTIRRPADVATRYGGEEFAIVLPDTDAVAASHMAERLRCAVASLCVSHPASPMCVVTVSIGAATMLPDETLLASLLIQQADVALYRAKASGRNCVAASDNYPAAVALSAPEEPPREIPDNVTRLAAAAR